MAAPPQWTSSPESSRPSSRARRYVQSTRTNSQQPPRSRRPHSNERIHKSSRCSPPRQNFPHTHHNASQPQVPIPEHWQCPRSNPPAPSRAPLELPGGMTMERTPSGHSILSCPPTPAPTSADTCSRAAQINTNTLSALETDLSATERVEKQFKRLQFSKSKWASKQKHERILRKLIYSPTSEELDDDALDGILTAANTVFFDGVLTGRVTLDWSDDLRYRTELIGTTALRMRSDGDGFETLIVLSKPILRNPSYDRRLLLSAFLHELIHCYLFISCGFEGRVPGGHTEGFHRIAELIDGWVGKGYLCLCKVSEDPRRWHIGGSTPEPTYEERGRLGHVSRIDSCSGLATPPHFDHESQPAGYPSPVLLATHHRLVQHEQAERQSRSPSYVSEQDYMISRSREASHSPSYFSEQDHAFETEFNQSRSPPYVSEQDYASSPEPNHSRSPAYISQQDYLLPLLEAHHHESIYVPRSEPIRSHPHIPHIQLERPVQDSLGYHEGYVH